MHVVPNHIELEKAFEDSFLKQPMSYSWGFFAYDDAPGGIGGGSGNFSWFDSKQELVSFLTKFPLLAHSSATPDMELFARAKEHLLRVTAETFDQRAVDELNVINSGVEQIQWFGQLEELLSGDGEFAEGLRAFFAGSSKQLSKTKIPEFVVFLRGWGH